MIAAIGTGLLFGLSAGLAPGPLLALVVAESVRGGVGRGVRVAVAPLLTDAPIVLGAVLLVRTLAGDAAFLLALVAFAGSLFVLHLARETWGAAGLPAAPAGASNPWLRGMTVNALSPHPSLFWLTVGAPALVRAGADGPGPIAGFLVAFYATLVGSKVALAAGSARAGRLVGGPGYRRVMRALALVLVLFAVGLVVEGAVILAGS